MTGFIIFLPANRYYSLDVKRNPDHKENTCPKWVPLLFIFQTAVLYFFASVAKLYPGWLRAEPMSLWLRQKAGYPIIGDLLQMDLMPSFISYGGIFFDGLIVPALLWKKTRKLALATSLFFHLFNSFVFQVGVFPYLMLALIVFFYPAETIRRIFFKNKPRLKLEPKLAQITLRQKAWVTILAFYALVQILLPLRHWTYKGDVHWTEEGHRIQSIQEAIGRLKDGTYGVCMDCEKKIQPGRLDVLPHAKLCVNCKSEREKNQHNDRNAHANIID